MKNSTSFRRILARRTRVLRGRLPKLFRPAAAESRVTRETSISQDVLEFRALQAGWQRYLPSFIEAMAQVEQLKAEVASLREQQVRLEVELKRQSQANP
ncbi:hypothetical protein ACLBV5_14640 [Brevundimonas sp. M1A4_2e]|uniref:hypothetical protein n=1 Tax=Brevundimonas sanguinis TaxID=3021811 RepID=UPI0024158E66|nr:hypothetical protein [Brevundimonas sp. NCCP 15609]